MSFSKDQCMLIPKFIKIGLAVLPRKGNRQAELFSKTVSNSYDISRGEGRDWSNQRFQYNIERVEWITINRVGRAYAKEYLR